MQTYTASSYNDGIGYSRTLRSEITPEGQETIMTSSGIGGTYIRRQVDAPVPVAIAPPVQEYTTAYSHGSISPGRVVETHVDSPGGYVSTHINHSPPTVVEARMDTGPIVETSMIGMSPVRTPSMMPSMLRMTSSPMRKPVTTTRTCFEPGYTMTEELPSNPHAPPIPLPGETIAVTVATGREGIHTRVVDDFGVFTETVANRKSPVRTYTTTIYEEGEPPRTYTTTFQDPMLAPQAPPVVAAPIAPAPLAPAPVAQAPIAPAPVGRFAGRATFVNAPEPIHPPAHIHAGSHHSRLDYAPMGVSQTRVEAGPYGHQETSIQSGPLGHQQRSVSSTPYGVQERRVESSPYGHHESTVHSTPFGQQEARVDSTPFGQQETLIEQNAFGRRKATVTHSPGRIDQAVTTSQKIGEAPVVTYY